ncbi:MAG TPA: hypothetical protein VI193_03630 [Acidimicrobiia bacterium]
MKRGEIIAFAAACLACCLPLLLGIIGVTTGATGAVGFWVGRNQALIVASIGLAYLVYTAARHIRAKASNVEKVDLTRKPS